MRRIRATAMGLGFTLTALAASAQEPGRLPAARLGKLVPVESTANRAQMPDPKSPMLPPGGTPMNPMGGTPMNPMGGAPTLGQPRPLTNPTVTAESSGAPIASPSIPAASMVLPTHGSPYPVMQGVPPSYVGTPVTLGAMPAIAPPSVAPLGAPNVMPAPDLDRPLYGAAIGPTALLGGSQRLNLRGEVLLWFVKSADAPPLVTTSSPQFNGILGQGDTQIVYGGGALPNKLHTGGRFGTTYWLDDSHHWGIDANIFFLGTNDTTFRTDTNQFPLLARPFNNLNQQIPFSEVVAAPGLAFGSVSVLSETQMWGADVGFQRAFLCGACSKLDLLAGFRFLNLNDTVQITEAFSRNPNASLDSGVPNALFGTITDRFRTVNHFYGVNLGMVGELRRGAWTFEGRAAVGLGTVFQFAEINGSQNIQFTNGPVTAAGGLLALPGANIGTTQQNKFGVVPEAGLRISYDITPRWKLGVGYNLIYINSVLRAGDQINPNLDVTRIPNFPVPGATPLTFRAPTVPLRVTDAFAQGVSFSLQYTW
ncbi:MAG: BBP7 family outer membrane beta-barrel protein [Fimbriiglobus sp.]